jgi:molybdopterin synthase sulfur carrier subunit
MPVVWVPAQLRELTGGSVTVRVSGATVGEVIENVDRLHPGIRDRLCDGDQLRSGLAIAVEDRIASLGLLEPVGESSEIHFLPAIGGGSIRPYVSPTRFFEK